MNAELQHRPKKIAKLIGLGIAASLALGACGSSGTGADDATAELPSLADSPQAVESEESTEDNGRPSEEDIELAMAQYEACLGELGVDISGLTTGDGAAVEELEVDESGVLSEDFDIETFDAAAEECAAELDGAFGDFELSPEEEAEFADSMLELERCVKAAGLDVDFSGNEIEVPEGVDFADFDEVFRSCEQSVGLNGEGEGQ